MDFTSRESSLKITHIVDEYTASAGGLSAAVAQIAQRTVEAGTDVEIVCTRQDSLRCLTVYH